MGLTGAAQRDGSPSVSVHVVCSERRPQRSHAMQHSARCQKRLGSLHGWFGMNMGSLGIQKPLAAAEISDYPTFNDVTP